MDQEKWFLTWNEAEEDLDEYNRRDVDRVTHEGLCAQLKQIVSAKIAGLPKRLRRDAFYLLNKAKPFYFNNGWETLDGGWIRQVEALIDHINAIRPIDEFDADNMRRDELASEAMDMETQRMEQALAFRRGDKKWRLPDWFYQHGHRNGQKRDRQALWASRNEWKTRRRVKLTRKDQIVLTSIVGAMVQELLEELRLEQ